jgi:hypothetical protein
MSDMMHTRLAHVWATQENYEICLRKLSGTERAAWQEKRRRQPADNEPREFFIYTMSGGFQSQLEWNHLQVDHQS